MRVRALCLLATLAACQRPAETPPPAPTPTTAPRATPAPAPSAGQAGESPPPLRLEPLAAEASQSFVEIRFPIAEQRITSEKAADYKVRLKSEGAGTLWLALDEHRPRSVARVDKTVTLSELVPADVDLAEGEHWLTAALLAEGGVLPQAPAEASRKPFAALRFWVGQRGARGEPAPRVVLLSPGGTYNGPDARVLIQAVALHVPVEGLAADGFRVSLVGAGRQGALALPAPAAVVAPELPSGDYRVEVKLVGSKGDVLATAVRDIVVNRDAVTDRRE